MSQHLLSGKDSLKDQRQKISSDCWGAKMFWKKKTDYINWDSYEHMIQTWDSLAFTQKSRQEYVQRMPTLGQ